VAERGEEERRRVRHFVYDHVLAIYIRVRRGRSFTANTHATSRTVCVLVRTSHPLNGPSCTQPTTSLTSPSPALPHRQSGAVQRSFFVPGPPKSAMIDLTTEGGVEGEAQ